MIELFFEVGPVKPTIHVPIQVFIFHIYCCFIHLLVVLLFIHICGSISSSKLTLKFFRFDAAGRREEATAEESVEGPGTAC